MVKTTERSTLCFTRSSHAQGLDEGTVQMLCKLRSHCFSLPKFCTGSFDSPGHWHYVPWDVCLLVVQLQSSTSSRWIFMEWRLRRSYKGCMCTCWGSFVKPSDGFTLWAIHLKRARSLAKLSWMIPASKAARSSSPWNWRSALEVESKTLLASMIAMVCRSTNFGSFCKNDRWRPTQSHLHFNVLSQTPWIKSWSLWRSPPLLHDCQCRGQLTCFRERLCYQPFSESSCSSKKSNSLELLHHGWEQAWWFLESIHVVVWVLGPDGSKEESAISRWRMSFSGMWWILMVIFWPFNRSTTWLQSKRCFNIFGVGKHPESIDALADPSGRPSWADHAVDCSDRPP